MGLQQRAEAATYRGLLALPERVQRVLAGRRVVARRPDARDRRPAHAAADAGLPASPASATLPIPEGRVLLRRQAAIAGGPQPIGAVRDLDVGGRPGRLYVPRGAAATGPLLVFLHGGGWVYGDLESHDPLCRFLAEQAQVRVLAVDYRLAPEHPFPAAYDDCLAAYRWVVDHAAALGADPAGWRSGGDSAGGTLAAAVAIAARARGAAAGLPAAGLPGHRHAWRHREPGAVQPTAWCSSRTSWTSPGGLPARPGGRRRPARLPAAGRPAAGTGAGVRRHGGVRPAARRGRGVRPAAGRRGGRASELRRFPDQLHGFVQMVGVGPYLPRRDAEVAGALRAALR